MDGWTDKWKRDWMDERIDKKWMDKWAERLMDERMNWIDDMLD